MVLRLDQAGRPYNEGEQVVLVVMNDTFLYAVNTIKRRYSRLINGYSGKASPRLIRISF